jgi:hypothetical protein
MLLLGTMNMNAGRSKHIISQAEHMSQILRETPVVGQPPCAGLNQGVLD